MSYTGLLGGVSKMPNFTTIGINFDVFNNISVEGITNLTNVTSTEFINNVPIQANNVTGGYYGIVVLVVLIIFLIQMLTDISQYGLFRYSTVRGLGIALGIAATFGIMMISVGYMTNFIHLSIVVTLYLLILIYIIIVNPT